jgi:predicted nucleotidyltransferase
MKMIDIRSNFPFGEELLKLINAIYDSKAIKSIYLIGSFARNEMNSHSDLDLIIICKDDYSYKIQQKLIKLPEIDVLDLAILEEYSGGFSPMIFSVTQLKNEPTLVKTILREGKLLKGDKIEAYLNIEEIIIEEKKDPKEFLKILDEIKLDF